jgi:hypothetical protein
MLPISRSQCALARATWKRDSAKRQTTVDHLTQVLGEGRDLLKKFVEEVL